MKTHFIGFVLCLLFLTCGLLPGRSVAQTPIPVSLKELAPNFGIRPIFLDDTIPLKGEIEISFWMSDIFKDLYTRTTFKVEALDGDGNSTQLHKWSGDANLDLVDRVKEEGLFRIKVTMPDNCNRLKVTARCRESRPSPVTFHHLLIRPSDTHIATPDHRLDNIPIKF